MQKRILAFLLAAAMTLSMAACGSTETEQTESTNTNTETTTNTETEKETETEPEVVRDTFTMAISYMPDALSPAGNGSDDYTTMTRPLYDKLFMENNEGGIDYYLAESCDISADGLTYTVKLRNDITWSDGTPITTKDVEFGMQYSIARYGYNRYIRVNGVEGSYEIIDDKNFSVTIPETYNYYIATLAGMPVLPAHALGTPEAFAEDQSYYSGAEMVTSGAYTVKEINEDSIVYVARDDYYRGTPSVKNVVLKVIGSGSTKAIAFENGEIDYMRITTVDELEKYSSQTDKYNIYTIPEARLNYLQVNPYGPGNLTIEQREALFYAINGDEVIAGAYGSTELAQNPNSYLVPTQGLYNEETPDYVYDLEKAKELSKSSGLEGKTLVYIYNKDRANMEEVAVVLQQQLAQIGVTLQIEGLDSTTFFNKFFGRYPSFNDESYVTWDLGTNGWDSMRGSTLYQSYTYFTQSLDTWGLTPTCGDLAVKVNTIQDPEERQKAADELMELAMTEYRIYPLTYTNYVMVSQKYVTGLDTCDIVPEFADWLAISVNG